MKFSRFALPILLILIFSQAFAGSFDLDTGFYTPPESTDPLEMIRGEKVKNVILMIGDGMGLPHLAMAQFAAVGPRGRLNIQRMPVGGFAVTCSANRLITDSGAAGTALATGNKTNNGMIGVLPDGTPLPTILELAHDAGLATGLVVTSSITHATPAAFAAHVGRRSDEAEIAEDLVKSGVDLMFGGGLRYFIDSSQEGSGREDELNLLDRMLEQGYTIVKSAEEIETIEELPVAGLFSYGPISHLDSTMPSIAEMTSKAIELLVQNRKGFFLMVEGSQIDWEAHYNEEDGIVRELLHFDLAVAEALKFAAQDGHTLVIVTSDHETGGLTIPEGSSDGSWMRIAFSSGFHTALPSPLFSYGPGALRFTGYMDNTDIPRRIAALLKLKGLMPPVERGDAEVGRSDIQRMMGR